MKSFGLTQNIRRFLQGGVLPGMSWDEAERVRLTNGFLGLFSLLTVTAAAVFDVLDYDELALITETSAMGLITALLLNQLGIPRIARWLLLMTANLATFWGLTALGDDPSPGWVLFALCGTLPLFLNLRSRLELAAGTLLPIVLFLITWEWLHRDPLALLSVPRPPFLLLFLASLALALLLSGLHFREYRARLSAARLDIEREATARIREREHQATRTQELFHAALHAGRMTVWDWNLADEWVTRFEPQHESVGRRLHIDEFGAMIHPEDREQWREAIRHAIETEVAYESEFRVLSRAGKYEWFGARGHVIRDDRGQPGRIVGASMQISDRKRAEQVVQEQRLKLASEAKMAALGEMAGGIAHEINNPLTIIRARAWQLRDLARTGKLSLDTVAEAAHRIDVTVARISRIVRSLRAFAREAEQDPLQRVPVRTIIEETLEFCRERFLQHGVQLLVDTGPEDLHVECRPVQISQVLLNLLNNAHDAVEGRSERWVRLAARAREEQVEISVQDSGPGVAPGLRTRLFEPFFTTKPVGKGTGLGLSVSLGIVQAHQGELSLNSPEDGSGACFRISLPLKRGGV